MIKLLFIFNRRSNRFAWPATVIILAGITGIFFVDIHGWPGVAATIAWFLFSAFLIWQGHIALMATIRKKWAYSYPRSYGIIGSVFIASLLYPAVVSLLMTDCWKLCAHADHLQWAGLLAIATGVAIIVTFITNIREIISLNHEREDNLSRVEQLHVAKAQAELEALKNQIDPHFIFNSLNTLSFLITKDPRSARLFNDTLAKVYRYILSNKDKDLVLLKEEVEFVSNYFYLLKIRFREAVNMEIEINDFSGENFLIPPISLQALVENAIKHNDFSNSNPLTIHITVSSNYILVKNAVQAKIHRVPASGTGLSNLDNRYKLITKRNITIDNTLHFFSVRLPVLKF